MEASDAGSTCIYRSEGGSKLKLIITSDWHLDASTAGMSRFDDVKNAVESIVYEACIAKVDMFVFLGDLTDPDSVRSHRSVAYAVNVALGLARRGISSRWLVGNHDVIEDGSGDHTLMAFRDLDCHVSDATIRLFDRPSTEMFSEHDHNDVLFVALPFTPRSHPYDPATYVSTLDFPPVSRVVVMGHLNIEGIGPGSETTDMPRGREVFFPVAAVQKRWPGALMLNGHIHKPQEFNRIYIPGSPCRFTFGEEHNSPGYIVCEV